ncbi:metal-dependent hydrolase family protein [Thermobispora bispora]|uniref:Amidohydrolase n=1 Tax=Thermobispora bispora (strain ATCC 19993 / DSM 43833 / CBS 139.67 / JCM 10125 / KCTC 9307 / NBRC 14880 / R51) TaxID=469371 RepID=D6Y4B0_THEBD|nr:amidohydrolase family protein [Thermobispora bispora]MBO2475724.1 amidohydrolase family protein [Actinomycetales bacterium]MBX6358313.1 amidohydrolase family protein [Micromonosporaceae bacterium]MDI9580171.1 amidohydrolase family protein [Thermobispora sp.]ADG87164.1 amidohydrolase [Thermobispora bispora DSM 43833]QSI47126.1 amidohydrolase family protein [Thermobispora bispora]
MSAFVLENANLLDLESGEFRPATSVRVEGDRIVEVSEPGATLTAPDDVPRLAAGGRTLLPGLIDAHVHAAITTMDFAALGRRAYTRIGIEAKAILERMLRRGFTTVRDAGGLDAGLKEALQLGLISGPRVFRSGRVLSQTGGHGDTIPPNPAAEPHLCACSIHSTGFAHIADGPDAVRRAVREELKGGADQIKVMAGGGVASPSDPIDMVQYSEEEIRVAVEEAARRRTYAFAHAYVPDAIVQAVRAGVRSIEHGNLIDAEAARVMAEHGCYLVPTLVTYDQLVELGRQLSLPPESMAKLDAVVNAGKSAIETALAAGVRIGFGTDLLGETHDAQSKEFLLRAEVQPPLDVLRSATLVNAELLGKTGELGVIAPGAYADLLLVDGDPLADISVLTGQGERLDLIVRGGEIVVNRLPG